jgi:hypothetical protein
VILNQLIDYDERIRRVHSGKCMSDFLQPKCEVCGKPIVLNDQFTPEIQKLIYKPTSDEIGYHEVDLTK